ncbi:MAG: MMPL family transporter [Myxococcota bacterium]
MNGNVDPMLFGASSAALLCAVSALAALRPTLLLDHPRSVLAGLLAVTLAATAALVEFAPLRVRLEIDPSTEALLPSGDPSVSAYREAVLDFGDDEVFVIAMESDDVFRFENLSALRRVSDRLSRIDGVRSVKSLVEVTSFRFVKENDWIEVRSFIDEIPQDRHELEALRSRAVMDPIYHRTLISTDSRTAALNVTFRKMTDRQFIGADLDGQVRAILREETVPNEGENTGHRRFVVSGRPHIKSRMYHGMTRDLGRLIPIALLVVALVLGVISGTVRGVVLPLATVATSVIWTFGAIALLERPLTVLTVLLAPTLVAIGSVYGLHVVNRYEEELRQGGDRRAVVARCQRHMIVPLLISGITTIVGFAALLITDVPAVFEIGTFSVLGVASVTAISLTGIPAALILLPHREPGQQRRLALAGRFETVLDRALQRLARFSTRRSKAVMVIAFVVTLAAAAMVPQIEIDTDYLSYFDRDAPVRREFETINRLLSGVVPLFVVIDGPGAGSLREPAVLRAIEELQRKLDAIPGVSRTLSMIDSLRMLNRAVSGDDPDEQRIPETRAAVTELLFMIPKADSQRFVTIDHSRANVIVRTGQVGSAAMRDLFHRIMVVVDDGLLPSELRVRVTGNALLLNRAADGVAIRQPLTVGLAAMTIFLLLTVGLRSFRLGLVAMIPNVVPVLIFFGVLGTGISPLSLPTSLIGSVALGVAIDATAHYIVRYRAERQAGLSPEDAVERCTRGVGRAIAIATTMLTLGFLSVTFSQFATLREFGYLSAMTMGVCGVTDLVLLPAVLVAVDRRSPQ